MCIGVRTIPSQNTVDWIQHSVDAPHCEGNVGNTDSPEWGLGPYRHFGFIQELYVDNQALIQRGSLSNYEPRACPSAASGGL